MSSEKNVKEPLVSVVVPVYSSTPAHLEYLSKALASASEQSYKNTEIIIVDDKSPQDILPAIESVESLGMLRIIRNIVNLGQARSRNIGIEHSEGELIAFLDHDDIWDRDKLAIQVEAIESDSELGMVFCGSTIIGENADRLRIDQSKIPQHPDFCWFVKKRNYTITASAVMTKKSIMQEIGGFDSRYSTCDDFDAWLKICRKYKVLYINRALVKYNLHAQNLSYTVDRLNDNILLTSLILSHCRTAPLVERLCLYPRVARKLVGRVYFYFMRRRLF